MKILFLTYDFPYPTTSGGKTRAYNLLKFAKKDANVTLFSFMRSSYREEDKDVIKRLGIEDIYTVPRRKIFDTHNLSAVFSGKSLLYSLYFEKEILNKLTSIVREKKIELIHFESFYTGFYINQVFRDLGIKQLYGSENIEYRLYEDQAQYESSMLKKQFFTYQIDKLRREEEQFYKDADAILTVTKSELEYVASHTHKPLFVIPNGVDEAVFTKQKAEGNGKTVLFIGNFTYFPNVDAMQFFLDTVFSKLPSTTELLIIGKGAERFSTRDKKRITCEPFLPDIRDAYKKAAVFISPMRVGGGTNFKVLEAMALGVPVVALEQRVKDFGFINGKELLIAKTASEFAEKVTSLLSDRKLAETLAKNARESVIKEYNWKTIGESLYALWRKMIYGKA